MRSATRGAALLALGLAALGCKRSSEPGHSTPAPSASAAPKVVGFAPKLELAKLQPIARFDGDFASKLHDGWISTLDTGKVDVVFSRQRKTCTISLPGGDPLSAACSRVSVGLRDDPVATDNPERITLIDSEPGAELSHFLVVDPFPNWLAAANGRVVASEVHAATTWANRDVTYLTGKQGPITVHRGGSHPASMPLPKEDETHGKFLFAAGHLFSSAEVAGTRRIKAYPLTREGNPLGAPTEVLSLDSATSTRPWLGCRAGDTTHLVLSELRPGPEGGTKAHHVIRARDGKLSEVTVEGRGHAEVLACTREGVRIVEKTSLSGTEALDIRCAGDRCTTAPLPKRLLALGVSLAPLGDRLVALWTDAGALRAEIGPPDSLSPSSTGGVLVEGASDASIHAIEVRGDEALVVFSVKIEMYAIALGANGRVRPVVTATAK